MELFAKYSDPAVHGFLHRTGKQCGDALVLTHGAGSNCQAPILVAVAAASAEAGITVLRCDLPFRQERPHGPPSPRSAARDRDGLKTAVEALRTTEGSVKRVFLGGHSYGGRQATILAAAEPGLIDGLLLLSYPLHPPRKPLDLRTAHFPKLRTPALFVHGSRDPFGTLEEMESALNLIPANTSLVPIEGAGHDLKTGRSSEGESGLKNNWPRRVVEAFRAFVPDV